MPGLAFFFSACPEGQVTSTFLLCFGSIFFFRASLVRRREGGAKRARGGNGQPDYLANFVSYRQQVFCCCPQSPSSAGSDCTE